MDNYENVKKIVEMILKKINLLANEISDKDSDYEEIWNIRTDLYDLIELINKEVSIIEYERRLAEKKLDLIKELLNVVQ